MTSTLRPRRLQGDRITIREIETETLIYEERTHRAWCLNRSSACIWQLCNGQNAVGKIAALATTKLGSAVSESMVLLTLEALQENGLLEDGKLETLPRDASRREVIGRIGLAAAALLPVIAAITAPPALAQSGSVGSNSRRRVRRPVPSSGVSKDEQNQTTGTESK